MSVPIISSDNHADSPVEILSPEISVQWIDGGRIYVICPIIDTRGGAEAWQAAIMALLREWPLDRTFCALFDLRSPTLGVSLRAGTILRQAWTEFHHISWVSAFVFRPRGAVGAAMRVYSAIPAPPDRSFKMFSEYDEAVRWLQNQFKTGSPDDSIDH